jgi:hypothetical protein
MATFNQQNQTVTYQYNADRIDFGSVRNTGDFIGRLQALKQELSAAKLIGALPEEVFINANSQLQEALSNASEAKPKKKSIIDHLEGLKKVVQGAAGAGALVLAVNKAIEVAGHFFH